MAFERDMGRILGYAILVETGFSLLALGLPGGAILSIGMILPRALAVGVWALGLMVLQAFHADLKYYSLSGAAWGLPFASAAVLVAQFSIAGIPLLAGFPIRLALWEGAAAQSGWVALGALLSVVGLFVSSLRTLTVLVMGTKESRWTSAESLPVRIFLSIGIAAIILVGITPQWVLPVFAEVIQSFPKLVP
jgi:multicomponent Na+:H+ antiporter subunit D